MDIDTTLDTDTQAVVVNDEEQYSPWPAAEPPPAGWRPEGFTGTTQECVDHIDRVWTDSAPAPPAGRSYW